MNNLFNCRKEKINLASHETITLHASKVKNQRKGSAITATKGQ